MKHIYILIITLLFSLSAAGQYTLTINDVEFDATTGTITKYTNTNQKDIIIPDNFGGVAVTIIGEYSFGDNGLTSVTIPNSVITIGGWSFWKNSLTSVTIPNSIKDIEESAFFTNSLKSITIPNSVITIGASAFNTNQLNNVIFETNSNIRSIGDYAFYKNNSLSAITLPTHSSVDFVEYYDNKGNAYKPGDNVNNFFDSYAAKIPYVIQLSDIQFSIVNNELSITKYVNVLQKYIVIPSSFAVEGQEVSVTSIGYGAFVDMNLVFVTIPNSMRLIGNNAFNNNLFRIITIPNSVVKIDDWAFYKQCFN